MSDSDLNALFSDYAKPLRQYLNYKLQDPHIAADLQQECFLLLAQRLQMRNDVLDRKAYLFKIANNLLLDHLRHQQRWQFNELHEETQEKQPIQALQTEALDHQIIQQQTLERIAQVLSTLPERTQTIFRLHRLEHMTQSEIARHLNVSLSTVEKHHASALAAMMRVQTEK